jgi:hypothetical protein
LSKNIINKHPKAHPYGVSLSATDGTTSCGCPHRALKEHAPMREAFIDYTAKALKTHHISDTNFQHRKKAIQSMKIKGLSLSGSLPYPSAEKTQRGNFAEIVLAEYLKTTTDADLPIYKLRYNPNVQQSMKGDDVLLFDLDSDPIRIIVGEAKFRKTPSKAAVDEIVAGLKRSHEGNLPVSLMFVANRLFDEENQKLGEKILQCAELIATDKLNIDYVGFLMSNGNASNHVDRSTTSELHNLLMISLGMSSPEAAVSEAYRKLEAEL